VLSAAGKVVPTQTAIVPEVELGPVRADFLPVQVHDLSRLERELGIPLVGLIGLGVLSEASFRLDYENKKIEFGDLSHKGIPVPFDARTSLAVVTVTFGSRPARMLVDTGSDLSCFLAEILRRSGVQNCGTSRRWVQAWQTRRCASGNSLRPTLSLPGNFRKDKAYFIQSTKILLLTVCWVCAHSAFGLSPTIRRSGPSICKNSIETWNLHNFPAAHLTEGRTAKLPNCCGSICSGP